MRKSILHFWELFLGLTEKELLTRYKNTRLGFLWIVVNPTLQMITIGFIFQFFISQPVEHYYYYLFLNLLLCNFFSSSIIRTTPSIIYERPLIKKTKFPHATIPLSIIASGVIHLIVAMLVFTILVLFLGTMSIAGLLYIFTGLTLLITFTVGVGLFTSAVNVRYRDLNFFVQAALTIWFYASPVVYTLALIPQDYYWLWLLNPLTSILQLFQHGFLGKPLPTVSMVISNTVIIVLVFAAGILKFRKESKHFDDWI